jgi:hypothetical protein
MYEILEQIENVEQIILANPYMDLRMIGQHREGSKKGDSVELDHPPERADLISKICSPDAPTTFKDEETGTRFLTTLLLFSRNAFSMFSVLLMAE